MPQLQGSQKIAFLLCKLSDFPNMEPQTETWFERLVARGTGGLNDYFMDNSMGAINLDGSVVSNWKQLDVDLATFKKNNPSRWDKVNAAITAHGVDQDDYKAVVAVYNVDVGDSGSSGGVLAGPGEVTPTFVAHELGHLFNFDHSFDQSSRKKESWSAPGEYYDRHDIMSARNVDAFTHSEFGMSGPLMNAPNRMYMEWLPANRVWNHPSPFSSSVHSFDLVSLGHPEVPGPLAAVIGGLFLEFRTEDRWDAGIPRDCVLIHSMAGANSVVLASDASNFVNDWQPGQTYGPSDLEMSINGGTRITVESFNLDAKTARITVRRQVKPPFVVGPAITIGGVEGDGGGWIILPSGKRVPIPPRSPLVIVLEQLSILAQAEDALSPEAFDTVSRAIQSDLMRSIEAMGARRRA